MDSRMTLICFYYLSLLDTLDSPCLHFNPGPLSLTSVSCTQLLDSISDSCIVADTVELSLISEDYHCVRYVPCCLFPMYML